MQVQPSLSFPFPFFFPLNVLHPIALYSETHTVWLSPFSYAKIDVWIVLLLCWYRGAH